jgi:hypothetical protein
MINMIMPSLPAAASSSNCRRHSHPDCRATPDRALRLEPPQEGGIVSVGHHHLVEERHAAQYDWLCWQAWFQMAMAHRPNIITTYDNPYVAGSSVGMERIYPDVNHRRQFRGSIPRQPLPSRHAGRERQGAPVQLLGFQPRLRAGSQRAEADHKRLDELASAIGDLVAQNTQLADENRRLAERLAVLEAAKPEKTKPRRVGEAE